MLGQLHASVALEVLLPSHLSDEKSAELVVAVTKCQYVKKVKMPKVGSSSSFK